MSTTNGMPLASVFPLKKKNCKRDFRQSSLSESIPCGALNKPKKSKFPLAVFLQQNEGFALCMQVCGLLLDDFSLYFHIIIIPSATEKLFQNY